MPIPIPLLDARAFEALQAHAGADFVLTLIEAFAQEAPPLVEALRAAAARGAAQDFETAAHTLKSNGITFGATRLSELARRLEWEGLGASAAAIDELEAALRATVPALRTLSQP